MPEIWYEGLYDRLDFEPCSSAWSPCSSVEATDSHLVPSPLFSTDSASAHSISRTPDLTIDSSTATDDESFEGLISTSQSVEKVSENLAMSDPLEACLSRLQKAYYGVNAARRASDGAATILLVASWFSSDLSFGQRARRYWKRYWTSVRQIPKSRTPDSEICCLT